MVLRPGNRGLAVQLLKIRLDRVRSFIQLYYPASPVWGPSYPENPAYDTITFLNIMAFQTMVNRTLKAQKAPLIKVDGVAGDQVFWCLAVIESQYNIHY